MTIKEEITETCKLLKTSQFNIADVVFEGGISVNETKSLEDLQALISKKKALGVIKLFYENKEKEIRVIHFPTQKQEESVKE